MASVLLSNSGCIRNKPQFSSVNKEVSVTSTGDAFVDDSYLGATSSYIPGPEETFSTMVNNHTESALSNLQILSQKWDKLLFTTGGAINLSKSFWIVFNRHWNNGHADLSALEIANHSLSLTEGMT